VSLLLALTYGDTAASARSGYWRLFYYNLQEEELKKDEQKQREKAQERTRQGSQTKPLGRKSVQQKPRTVESEVEVWTPPYLPKPVFNVYKRSELPDITQYLNVIRDEFRGWITVSTPLWEAMLAKEAANDEEHDLELLLLSA